MKSAINAYLSKYGIELVGDYVYPHLPVLFKCQCGAEWETRASYIFDITCPVCDTVDDMRRLFLHTNDPALTGEKAAALLEDVKNRKINELRTGICEYRSPCRR